MRQVLCDLGTDKVVPPELHIDWEKLLGSKTISCPLSNSAVNDVDPLGQ